MNPHQAPMHPSGNYNNHPPQQVNNAIPPIYQPPIYQSYSQYIPPTQHMVGYNPIYHNPQHNPHSNMGSVPQRDILPGNQHNQMMQQHQIPSMHNRQIDVLSNIQDQYHQNPIHWPSNHTPYPSDPHFYQFSSNQQPVYMPGSIVPNSVSGQIQPPNHAKPRPPFYSSYQPTQPLQQIQQHSLGPRSFPNPKNPKKANAHQGAKNQSKNNNNTQGNAGHNRNQNQPKPKSNKNAKKQKKQSGHDSKKQIGRDSGSIERIPTSIILEKQREKWGWVLPPLLHRSLNSKTSTTNNIKVTTDKTNSSAADDHSTKGFTLPSTSLLEMDSQEEEELNNEKNENNENEDDILYNDDSDDENISNNLNNSDDNNENGSNMNDSDDSENDSFSNNDDNDNENISNSDDNTDAIKENDNDIQQETEHNENTDIFNKYRDNPIKRVLFLWDEIFKT